MTAFSTFAYSKKYFVSPEIEFVTEPDLEFGETYKPPQDLINLLADNLIAYEKVGIGTTNLKAKLYSYGTVGVGSTEVLGFPVNTLIENEDENSWAIAFRRTDLGPNYDVAAFTDNDGTFYIKSGVGVTGTYYSNLGISTNNFQVFTNDSISFRVDSNADSLVYNNLLVGTQTLTGTPNQRLQVFGGGYFSDSVGIGITTPSNTLTVTGSGTSTAQLYVPGISTFISDIYVLGPLWDKVFSKGTLGQVLLTDSNGVFWGDVSGIGTPLQTIGIFDESNFQGIVANLNFLDGNDPNNLVSATISGLNTSFADIVISDRWSLSGSDIYRISNVGIGITVPSSTLDISGTVHATGAVDFDSTLNVDGDTTLNLTLDVDGATTLNNTLDVDGATTLNDTLDVDLATTLNNTLDVDGATTLNDTLDVDLATTLNSTLDVDGATTLNSTLDVDLETTLNSTLDVDGATTLNSTLDVIGITTLRNQLIVGGATSLASTLDVDGATTLNNVLDVIGITTLRNQLIVGGATSLASTLDVIGITTLRNQLIVGGATSLANTLDVIGITTLRNQLIVGGATSLASTLNVGGATTLASTLTVDGASVFNNTVELNSSLIDINNSTATGKFDYRLSSVGTGVSWRPPGVQTQNAIWVTMDGNDSNTGYLEGDAKRTVGAAASIAQEGDTIFVRSGVYFENNPIGLRTDVSVSGQDLRLVTIVPNNITKDVFHVRRGCLIENLNFSGSNISIAHTGCGAVAFPPINPSDYAVSGYIAPGPTTEGPTGRWRSPYIRNCTNFMTKSIGMKINGDHATAATIGNDLKCMVCDSFTQYNEAGVGVSITNNGYAQLVSIFTINCDIAVYADTGGSCDLTNSNSSFGNFGLVAVGLGSTEFTGTVGTYPPTRTEPGVDAGSDKVTFVDLKDNAGNVRRPYDGQALFFKINLDNYPDAQGTGTLQAPMVQIKEIKVTNTGSGYSPATPPTVFVYDDNDQSQQPKGPQGIIAELSPTIDEVTGAITSIDVVNSGRNYLPTQNLKVFIDGGSATADVISQPIYYSVDSATKETLVTGITTVTFTEFIPYGLFGGEEVSLKRISRILTSSHSFEYIGTGTDINTSTPFKGGVSIKENEIVALDGAQIPFTSTDQKGNFDIGEGFQINQPSAVIRGRDFSKAIQAEVTPLILALR